MSWYHVSAYSPWLAPIELTFSYIKQLLKTQTKGKTIDLKAKAGRDEMLTTLKALTSVKIAGYFKMFTWNQDSA